MKVWCKPHYHFGGVFWPITVLFFRRVFRIHLRTTTVSLETNRLKGGVYCAKPGERQIGLYLRCAEHKDTWGIVSAP